MRHKYQHYALLLLFFVFTQSVQADRTIVKMQTNYGDIYINLYNDEAPITVDNFLGYVNRGFYNGLIIHRIEEDFVIQGGAYDPNLYDADFSSTDPNFAFDPNYYHEPNDPIVLELDAELQNLRGTIAMARTSELNSATSQFFINIEDNESLDPGGDLGGYAVFGEVIDGMDVVDTLNLADVEDKNDSFSALPVDPVIIKNASVLREFGSDSADFSDVPFLGATAGTIRSFAGQGMFAGSEFQWEFTEEQLLNINCLKWHRTESSDGTVSNFTMYIARDTDGKMWILKYVTDEGTDDEQVVIEAENLMDAVSFEEFALDNMFFRLITGEYNPDNLDDSNNTISNGFGASKETEQIISVTESLAPAYPDSDLVLVKWTKGPVDNPSDIKWRYYDPNEGLVFDLWDDDQNVEGDGWLRAAMNFDDSSDDFSDVPFLGAVAGTVRTFVGQGSYELSTYTQTFTAGEEAFQGVNYLVWQQSDLDWDSEATPVENDIVSFSLRLAKDTDGNLWVFEYTRNNEKIFEAEYLYEARRLSDFDEDDMLFRLITQGYNADNLDDPVNTITVGSGSESQTEKITSFTETLDQVPHYQNELVQVKKWTGVTENDDNISYYHDSVGLILNLRNGQTGNDGDGWHLAFFGGTFDDASYDLTDVPFLNASSVQIRSFFGQGSLTDPNDVPYFTHKFSQQIESNTSCLRWRLYPGENADLKTSYIDIAKDSLGTLWVFRYYDNGETLFSSSSTYDAVLLSDYADRNMQFRLITGMYDPDNLSSAENTITYDVDGDMYTEQIVSFNASADFAPYYEDQLVLVKISHTSDLDDIRWRYYHINTGLVLELQTLDDPPTPDTTTDGYRLGWYGKDEPTFDSDSYDFSDVAYFQASPGQLLLYQGQGQYEGAIYRRFFTSESLLGVSCLKISETAVSEFDKPAIEMFVARGSDDSLWLLKAVNNNEILFEASTIDQIVPFDWVPDIQFQLAAGNNQVGTIVSSGTGTLREAQTIVRDEQSLDDYETFSNYDEELLLIKTAYGEDPNDVTWSWYHESTGLVLDLWDNFTDPNLSDPNVNDPNDLAPIEGDGWFLAEPNELENLAILLKAGKTRNGHSDTFKLQGDLALTADDFAGGDFFLAIGPYSLKLDIADMSITPNAITWRGSPDGTSYVAIKFDLRKETFAVVARKVDLTGLQDPIQVSLQIGIFFSQGTAEVKGNKNIPILLLQGQADKIQLKNFNFINTSDTSDPAYPYDKLVINGEIATIDYPLDLSVLSATIEWGSTSLSISNGDIRRIGKRQIFIYHHPTADLRYARFDLAKGVFTVRIRKSGLSAPSQTFTLTFTDADSNTVFSQSMTVSGP